MGQGMMLSLCAAYDRQYRKMRRSCICDCFRVFCRSFKGIGTLWARLSLKSRSFSLNPKEGFSKGVRCCLDLIASGFTDEGRCFSSMSGTRMESSPLRRVIPMVRPERRLWSTAKRTVTNSQKTLLDHNCRVTCASQNETRTIVRGTPTNFRAAQSGKLPLLRDSEVLRTAPSKSGMLLILLEVELCRITPSSLFSTSYLPVCAWQGFSPMPPVNKWQPMARARIPRELKPATGGTPSRISVLLTKMATLAIFTAI